MNQEIILPRRTFEIPLQIMMFVGLLQDNKKFLMPNPVFRNNPAYGANFRKVQKAVKIADPTNLLGMEIVMKHMDETKYWLLLFKAIQLFLIIAIIYYK